MCATVHKACRAVFFSYVYVYCSLLCKSYNAYAGMLALVFYMHKIRQVVWVLKQFSFALFFVFVYVYICLCMYVFWVSVCVLFYTCVACMSESVPVCVRVCVR